ncbi:unnamed protein product [Pleuronectes platessa]|uniref:Uncharacterized protein n=1 Tax=Pleuronectes platessa TaxID=8262 RepID=A0A9N7VD87_PLEPL|nr:unnamed protein product [Pleuronectes platessa]
MADATHGRLVAAGLSGILAHTSAFLFSCCCLCFPVGGGLLIVIYSSDLALPVTFTSPPANIVPPFHLPARFHPPSSVRTTWAPPTALLLSSPLRLPRRLPPCVWSPPWPLSWPLLSCALVALRFTLHRFSTGGGRRL